MTSQLKEKTSRISYVVFIITVAVVVINLVSLFFPALIASLTAGPSSVIDPFEPGALALPFLVTNVIVFSFWYSYNRKKLLTTIQNSVKFILKFEISRKVATILIIILLGGYVVFTAAELSIDERDQWDDFRNIQNALSEFPDVEIQDSLQQSYVKLFLLLVSQEVFQNIKVLPFIASISLLLVTYFLALEISKKRFAGIVAMIILLQSNLFLRYDTVATYSNFWTLFFVLSLYLIYKRWYLSPVSYFLSIFSKPLTAVFLPMVLFFTYRANIPRKKKIRIVITYTITTVILAGIIVTANTSQSIPITAILDHVTSFSYSELWSGFTVWAFQLRFDTLVVLFTLPLTVGLFMVSRQGVPEADSILVLILGILLSAPLLAAFTTYDLQPYRFVPLIVFFAIGVGTLLSKKITQSG